MALLVTAAPVVLMGCTGLAEHCRPFEDSDEGGYCATTEEEAAYWRTRIWRQRFVDNE